MKVRNEKSSGVVRFSDIRRGDTFMRGKEYFIKADEKKQGMCLNEAGAGILCIFNDGDIVTPVTLELVVV